MLFYIIERNQLRYPIPDILFLKNHFLYFIIFQLLYLKHQAQNFNLESFLADLNLGVNCSNHDAKYFLNHNSAKNAGGELRR